MYSKLTGYFRPSRSVQRQSSMNTNGYVTADESDYYANGSRNNAPLRFVIIRHGERVDNTYGAGWTQHAFNYAGQYYPFDGNMPSVLPSRSNWLHYEVDTPLTANGLKQSWYVGNVLARSNLPVVACYASPAIRSIQTADQILEGLSRKAHIPIRLELGLFECSSWYAQSPINFMSDQELINSGFNIDTGYRSQVGTLPSAENEYQYYERSKQTMKNIIKLHRNTGGTVLLVAHAPSLEVLTRHLMNGKPRPEQLIDLCSKVGYCSMTIVDAGPSPNSWQFRYSLDDQPNWQQQQQQQLEQSNNILTHSASVAYQPTDISANYMVPAPQFQYFPQQEIYSPNFVI